MIQVELEIERRYRIEERLGMICEDQPATPEQQRLAEEEGRRAIAGIKRQEAFEAFLKIRETL